MQKNEIEELILRRTVNWDDLRYFIVAADTGSLNQAATRLGVTQPTLSRRIDNLEYSLGAKLFQRQPNGIALTAAGTKVLKYATAMQTAANDIGRLVAGSDESKSGSVKLYSPDGLAAYWLTPGLRDFQRANPKLTIELINAMFTAFDPDQQIDVAVQFDESKHIDAIAYPLGNLHYCFYASREYLQTYGTPKTLQDLLSHRVVTHENYRYQKHSWDREIEALKELCNIVLQTNCSASLVNAIRDGLGIGALPTYFAGLDVDVVPLQLELKASVKFWAVFHRDVGKTARVRAVIDWLKTRFDANRYPWFADEFIHPHELAEMMKSRQLVTEKSGTGG
jgi:DNA-binding transcriptional LysR family regulator